MCPSDIGSWYILNTLYKEVKYVVKICIGAGRLDVLLTIIVTMFDIENLWISGCDNEGVPDQFYHLYAYSIVGRNYAVGRVTTLRTKQSSDRIPVGATFPETSKLACCPPNLLYNGYRVSFTGVKRPIRCVDHASSSNVEVKERVHLYFYSLSGTTRSVLGRTLYFLPIIFTKLFNKRYPKRNHNRSKARSSGMMNILTPPKNYTFLET